MLSVTRKELTDGFRDRRALYTILFGTLAGPILFGIMFTKMAGQEKAAQDIQIPVVGRELAPLLVNWLGQQPGVEVTAGPANPEVAVRDGDLDVVLVIEKEFAEKFRDSRPAPVKVVSDSTRQTTRSKVRRVNSLLSRFSSETGSLRLIARGVNPVVASALKVDQVEVSSSQQRAATIFNFIPMFLILSTFSAGMHIATDSTAGERERGSLEPLLLNPIPRLHLLRGKWLAAATSAFGGMVATLLVTAMMVSRLSLEDLGVRFHLGWGQMLMLVVSMTPMALVAPAIQMYLACFARSFKEAQGYMAFLVFAATVPGLLAVFYPTANVPWLQWAPLVGQYRIASDILSGKIPSAAVLINSAVAALALAALFLRLATRMFSAERIIFGR
jgi:sodium transport system permease protein